MNEDKWQQFSRIGEIEARPYEPGEDLKGISVNAQDTPAEGGMIARDPRDRDNQWYINPKFFRHNYRVV